MQTEIIKIIEGGLSGDKTKVLNYADALANNADRDGNHMLARRIRSTVKGKSNSLVTLDSLSAKPVDEDSRLNIVDVEYVSSEDIDLVLNKFVRTELENFIASYSLRDFLAQKGLDAPNSLLLYGPPGCGKTSVARLIAAETDLPLVTARLDSLVSSLLGSTAKNIRKVFDFASRQACVLFLDEFDVIAKMRDDRNELGELKRVVNSLLQNIDDFGSGSILVAATNHQELLDNAVWRRFTEIIEVPMPGQEEVHNYLERMAKPLMVEHLSKKCFGAFEGFSYSTIKTIVQNSFRDAAISGAEGMTNFGLVKEAYIQRNHGLSNDWSFIEFLLMYGASIRQINAQTGYSTRMIQKVSKEMRTGGVQDVIE
jgi:SpoVK/Ycf46/Vps4 family AAA+-type ATPase